jgi:GGDEF domain-containing protein
LKGKDLSAEILHKVAERLGERMEECLEALKSRSTTRQKTLTPGGVENPTAVPGVFEENAAAGAELHAVMEQMRASANEKEAVQGQVVVQEAPSDAEPADEEKAIKAALPKGILNRNSILYILEKEIDRTIRYETPFSVLMLAIYKVTPAKPLPAGTINRDDVMHFVLSNLVRISRSSDILGVLDRNKFLALMPMATGKNSKAAMRRILKGIHDVEYSIEETPVVIKLAATVTTFDKDRTPNLNDFIKRAESDIFDMVNRLRNIQSIY